MIAVYSNDLQISEQCLELCSTLKVTKKKLGKTHIFQELLYSLLLYISKIGNYREACRYFQSNQGYTDM